MTLVYGGGNIGLMGILADAAMQAGGRVIGVIPESLEKKEVAHRGLTELQIVGSMHERKATMASLSDAFVALPGGFGTLEEFCEIVTWNQLGLCLKPCGLLNVDGYFDPLVQMFEDGVEQQFIRPQHGELVISSTDIEELLDAFAEQPSASVEKWLNRT